MQKNNIIKKLSDARYIRDYRPIPFWSWNDKLEPDRLVQQIEWMHRNGIGGFFMHARGGLLTEYLGEEWMQCCDACCEKAAALDMDAYMYDENGWPSGFAGGKLLSDENNRDRYLTHNVGAFDKAAMVSYKIDGQTLQRADKGDKTSRYLNVYCHTAVSTVDILNPDVVEKFLNSTHRAYKARYGERFSQKIKGFFTDEPQYFRWDTAYTPMIERYFQEHYGQDVLDGLGLLFAEKQGYETFRFRYWSGMRALFLQNFAKKLYDFCQENNMSLTGHYVEESSIGYQIACCGGVMPFYEYEHIPGIDWLGRDTYGELAVKQVGSAAAQCGKKRVITETFGCCGWDVTPRELKKLLDYQYVGGVNVMCHHLLPYAEYGQRKRDYPQHYTPLNPWINRHFKRFNDCYTRLGALIGNSTELADVCVLLPVTAAYIDFRRNEPHFGVEATETFLRETVEGLGEAHIGHHYVDETLLAKHGKTENGKLVCGRCAYRYCILPSCKNLTASTYALLQEFAAAGGKLLITGDAPAYLDGVPFTCELTSTATMEEIKSTQPYAIDNHALRSCMRMSEEGAFVFVINPTAEAQTFTLHAGLSRSARVLDTDALTLSKPRPLTQTLRGGQSVLLYPCDKKPKPQPQPPVVPWQGDMRVVRSTANTMAIDAARIARDGEDFGESKPLIQIFAELLEERYAGKLRLQYEFESRITPSDCKLYAEDMNTYSVEINGVTVQKQSTLEHEPKVGVYDVAEHVQKGVNKVVITLHYYQDESVYFALFGEGVTESLRNCMVYNTALESVYLAGEFGVYPVGLRDGQTDATAVCDGFVIDAPQPNVRDFLRDGYAMFAGEITLEHELECGKDGCVLEIGGRWQTAEIECNGKRRTLLFDTAADISDMVKKGKNTVRVTLTTSLRNLMGPHHFALCDEPTAVGPETFDLSGHWKDGCNALLRPSYSLVKTSF